MCLLAWYWRMICNKHSSLIFHKKTKTVHFYFMVALKCWYTVYQAHTNQCTDLRKILIMTTKASQTLKIKLKVLLNFTWRFYPYPHLAALGEIVQWKTWPLRAPMFLCESVSALVPRCQEKCWKGKGLSVFCVY